MLSILKPFRRDGAPQARVPSELWRIDLGPVAEPMMNGHTERMNFVVTERIALGKSAKRATAQPIGRATERDFDWKSVQSPDRWRDATEDRDRKVNGSGFSPASGLRESESKRPAHPLERVFGREAREREAQASRRSRRCANPRVRWRRSSPSWARSRFRVWRRASPAARWCAA